MKLKKLSFAAVEKEFNNNLIVEKQHLSQIIGGLDANSSLDDIIGYFEDQGFAYTTDANGNGSFEIPEMEEVVVTAYITTAYPSETTTTDPWAGVTTMEPVTVTGFQYNADRIALQLYGLMGNPYFNQLNFSYGGGSYSSNNIIYYSESDTDAPDYTITTPFLGVDIVDNTGIYNTAMHTVDDKILDLQVKRDLGGGLTNDEIKVLDVLEEYKMDIISAMLTDDKTLTINRDPSLTGDSGQTQFGSTHDTVNITLSANASQYVLMHELLHAVDRISGQTGEVSWDRHKEIYTIQTIIQVGADYYQNQAYYDSQILANLPPPPATTNP